MATKKTAKELSLKPCETCNATGLITETQRTCADCEGHGVK